MIYLWKVRVYRVSSRAGKSAAEYVWRQVNTQPKVIQRKSHDGPSNRPGYICREGSNIEFVPIENGTGGGGGGAITCFEDPIGSPAKVTIVCETSVITAKAINFSDESMSGLLGMGSWYLPSVLRQDRQKAANPLREARVYQFRLATDIVPWTHKGVYACITLLSRWSPLQRSNLLGTRSAGNLQYGKNHLGDKNEFLPTVHGFNEFFGYLYHLDAMEDPAHPDYPQNLLNVVGPRNMVHSWATEVDPH